MNYKETIDTLYTMMPDFQKVGASAYKPGLERVTDFNRHLGFPDRSFYTVHVAGTNGKGSVSHILASVLQSAGYRVGLFTSPHLHDFRERIKIDGEMIPEKFVVDFTEQHIEKMSSFKLSFFEATTAMAFDYFSRNDVEIAIIETGLGGRLDSTNIIKPLLSIITNIGMDHMSYLGETLEQIAYEKAGIIKHGIPALIGEANDRTTPVFNEKAAKEQTSIKYAEQYLGCIGAERTEKGQTFRYSSIKGNEFEVFTDLLGNYQSSNVKTALVALEILNKETPLSISARAIKDGIGSVGVSTGLRGRWEIIDRHPLVICDTGHNAHGIAHVVEQLKGEKYKNLFMIIGVVNDKELKPILELLPENAHFIFTQPSIERALAADKLAENAAHYRLQGIVINNVKSALEFAREKACSDDLIFIGGSTFTVADALS